MGLLPVTTVVLYVQRATEPSGRLGHLCRVLRFQRYCRFRFVLNRTTRSRALREDCDWSQVFHADFYVGAVYMYWKDRAWTWEGGYRRGSES